MQFLFPPITKHFSVMALMSSSHICPLKFSIKSYYQQWNIWKEWMPWKLISKRFSIKINPKTAGGARGRGQSNWPTLWFFVLHSWRIAATKPLFSDFSYLSCLRFLWKFHLILVSHSEFMTCFSDSIKYLSWSFYENS